MDYRGYLILANTFGYNWGKTGEEGYDFVFVFPFAVVAETVPVIADISLGLLDFVTLGYFGNSFYRRKYPPLFWKRSNELPWINKY